MLDTACQMRQAGDWKVPNRHSHVAVNNEEIYSAYWQQTQCMHQHVMKMIKLLESNPDTQNAIIFVHGDHGSRINKTDEALNSEPDNVQTLLAIKHGGKLDAIAGVHEAPIVLQHFFPHTVRQLVPSH